MGQPGKAARATHPLLLDMNCKPKTHSAVRCAAYRLGHAMADVLPPVNCGKAATKDAPLCHALLSCAVEVLRQVPAEQRSMPVILASINGTLDHMLPLLNAWLLSGEFIPSGIDEDAEASQHLAVLLGEGGILSSIVGGSDTLALALLDTSVRAAMEPCLFLYAQGFKGDACPQRACAMLMEPCGEARHLPVTFEDIMENC